MPTDLRATYRVQLHAGFTFADAARLLPYLHQLGISHLYCSPYLQAAPGSKHGYDVVNHRQVNSELGGAAGLDQLQKALQEQGMGQVLDIVPNHMAIGGSENPWWHDVLENGVSSRYASYFDVEWDPAQAQYSNTVLLPVLGDQYGRVLEAGDLKLAFQDGRFYIQAYDRPFPLDPRSAGPLLAEAAQDLDAPTLAFLADAFANLPADAHPGSSRRRDRDKTALYTLLDRWLKEEPKAGPAIQKVVQSVNCNLDRLDRLVQEQNYRLAFWRVTRQELGYRRFFDVDTLIGLRMEEPEVFYDTHALILGWLTAGALDGLRIDHPDGLRDPQQYFERLRAARQNTWLVVEKILEPGEHLPESWPVAGTVGYDFLQRANQLQVDPAAEEQMTRIYAEFSGEEADYPAVMRAKKHQVLREVLGSDVNRLVVLLGQVTEQHRLYRDYTQNDLRAAIREIAAGFPVYRTYLRPGSPPRPEDKAAIQTAVDAALEHSPDLDPRLLDFVRDLLLLRMPGELETEFALRFQQFTGPAMAKGVEDTTFYNYHRLISLNEVGSDPGHFGLCPADFHVENEYIQQHWPRTMLALSTHDTKRGEDMRARLNVLSEIPADWGEAVRRWCKMNARHKSGGLPDPNMEYFLYQTLVGAWPLDEERLLPYLQKAAREAKAHTSWVQPDEQYEQALAGFARALLADSAFLEDMQTLLEFIRPAGQVNSLSQTLLKLTSPGIPDTYQGCELWNFSLVDPDNRRPVDYDLRQTLLNRLQDNTPSEEILREMEVGLPKLWVTRQALALRRRLPQCFGPQADYQPLLVSSEAALAYTRAGSVAVIVPHLPLSQRSNWGDTQVRLPEGYWRNLLSGDIISGGTHTLENLLARFPVALLERKED